MKLRPGLRLFLLALSPTEPFPTISSSLLVLSPTELDAILSSALLFIASLPHRIRPDSFPPPPRSLLHRTRLDPTLLLCSLFLIALSSIEPNPAVNRRREKKKGCLRLEELVALTTEVAREELEHGWAGMRGSGLGVGVGIGSSRTGGGAGGCRSGQATEGRLQVRGKTTEGRSATAMLEADDGSGRKKGGGLDGATRDGDGGEVSDDHGHASSPLPPPPLHFPTELNPSPILCLLLLAISRTEPELTLSSALLLLSLSPTELNQTLLLRPSSSPSPPRT